MLSPRFIPQSVFYTQSVVRSPQSVFYTDRVRMNQILHRDWLLKQTRKGSLASAGLPAVSRQVMMLYGML